MTKHTAIIFLGALIIIIAIGGFPPWVHKYLLVLCGFAIAVLGYLSSVVYCSNCKKLMDEAEQALPTPTEASTDTAQGDIIQAKKIQ